MSSFLLTKLVGLKLINRYSFVLLASMVILSSCVTKKKKEDVSFLRKTYQNITSKYNGYFNANVIYQEAIVKLNAQHNDNYAKILDLYPYMAIENPKSMAPDMDKIVEKVSTVATLHPASDWVDDCYLLAGQAQYLKQDFESAEETLEFMAKNFSPEGIKERMKGINKQKLLEKEKRAKEKQKEIEKREKEDQREEAKLAKEKTKKEILKEKEKARKAKEKEKKAKAKEKKKASKNKSKSKTKTTPKQTTTPNVGTKEPDQVKIMDPVVNDKVDNQKEKELKAEEDKKAAEKLAQEKKKASEKPDKYFLKRKPVYQDGLIWLARTYIEEQKYDEALSVMNKILSNPKTFPHILAQLNEVRAYYFLKQKKYELAIEPLEAAINSSNNKKDKARFSYIVAQIHQNSKREAEALSSFHRTIKFQPAYEMEFNARLNIALNGHRSGKTPVAEARKYLQKMLKDTKNTEFKDQIYFTLAKLDIETKDFPTAISDLRASLAANTANKIQKTESYLLLAELYYNQGNFVNSKSYYDSTLQVMATVDDRFLQTKRFSLNLTEIAKNQQVIFLQDSLIKIAGLSPDEQLAVAKTVKKQREEEAKRAAQKAATPQSKVDPNSVQSLADNRNSFRGVSVSGNSKSTFFAYDEKLVKKGQKEFQKLWGQRDLVDNWRRIKSSSATLPTTPDNAVASSEDEEKLLKEILADVPKSPQEIDKAENLIKAAMITLGRLYQDQLKDDDRSIAMLEDLLKRYPANQYELEAWYLLYLAYNNKGDMANVKTYYDKIVEKYPTTTYARVISDPKFLEESKAERNKLDRFYNETYSLFQATKYQEAQDNIKKAAKEFGADNKYKVKFALLNAMILGNLEGKTAYIGGLKEIIAKYPNTEEEKRAKEIIRLLGVESASPLGKDTLSNVQAYTYTPGDVHYVLVDVGNVIEKLNDMKNGFANFNKEFYSFDKLKVTNIFLDTETPLIVIRQFEKSEGAFKYVDNALKNLGGFYKDIKPEQLLVISKENYKALLLNKKMTDYKAYLEQNYRR